MQKVVRCQWCYRVLTSEQQNPDGTAAPHQTLWYDRAIACSGAGRRYVVAPAEENKKKVIQ